MNGDLTCKHVLDELDDYRRGQLKPSRRDAIEAHLAGCASCRQELAAREALQAQIKTSMPDATAPTALPQAVLTSIRQSSNQPYTRKKPSKNLLPGMLTAAALLLVLVGGLYLRPGKTPRSEIASSEPGSNVSDAFIEDLTESTRRERSTRALTIPDQATLASQTIDQQTMKPASATPPPADQTQSLGLEAKPARLYDEANVPSQRAAIREEFSRSATEAVMKAETTSRRPSSPASAPARQLTPAFSSEDEQWAFSESRSTLSDQVERQARALSAPAVSSMALMTTATVTTAPLTTQTVATTEGLFTTSPASLTTFPLDTPVQ